MAEIPIKIVMCGMICLAIIYLALIISGHDDSAIGYIIVGAIAGAIGFVIPAPKYEDKRGVLKW